MLAFYRQILLPLLLAALVALAAGCSGAPRPTLADVDATDSTVTVVVGDVTYALDAACYQQGDDLTAVGVGTDATGHAIKGLIRGPASAYVGLMFGDDEYIYEADTNVTLTIARDGDRLVGEQISFVRDIDFASADAAPVGVGSVVVDCRSIRQSVAPTLTSR